MLKRESRSFASLRMTECIQDTSLPGEDRARAPIRPRRTRFRQRGVFTRVTVSRILRPDSEL